MALDWFGNGLDPEIFSACIDADPEAAHSRVLERLSDEQFDDCIRNCPSYALFDQEAVLRMTWQQFDFCVTAAPENALRYVPEQLTNQQLNFCCSQCPSAALEYATDYLIRKQVVFCYNLKPEDTIQYAGYKIPVDLLPTVCEEFPEWSLRYIDSLSDSLRMNCICRDPWRAISKYPAVLKTRELLMLFSDYRLEVRNLIKQSPWHEIVDLLQPHLKDLDKNTARKIFNAQKYRRQ